MLSCQPKSSGKSRCVGKTLRWLLKPGSRGVSFSHYRKLRLDLCGVCRLGVVHGRRRYRTDPAALHTGRVHHGRQQRCRADLGRSTSARRTARKTIRCCKRHSRPRRCRSGTHFHVKSGRLDDRFVGRSGQSPIEPHQRKAAIRSLREPHELELIELVDRTSSTALSRGICCDHAQRRSSSNGPEVRTAYSSKSFNRRYSPMSLTCGSSSDSASSAPASS
jgi:hypothetical protein